MVVHKNRTYYTGRGEKQQSFSWHCLIEPSVLLHGSVCKTMQTMPRGCSKNRTESCFTLCKSKKASRNTVPFVLSPFTGIYHLLEPRDNHAIKSTSEQAPNVSKNLSSYLCPQSLIQLKATDWLLPGAGKAQPLTSTTGIAVLGDMERPGLLTPCSIHGGGDTTRGPDENCCAVAGACRAVPTLTSSARLNIVDLVTVAARFFSLFSSTLPHSSLPTPPVLEVSVCQRTPLSLRKG